MLPTEALGGIPFLSWVLGGSSPYLHRPKAVFSLPFRDRAPSFVINMTEFIPPEVGSVGCGFGR